MKLAVIGVGYVGLVSAACFAELGHDVIAVDNDTDKVALLRAGHIPIHEELLPELVARHTGGRLHFSSDIGASVRASDVVFICVGTPPSHHGDADMSYVEAVTREIAGVLDRPKLIVEKSTVPVGTCDAVFRTMVRHHADPRLFRVASNPEFLREGTAVTDFLYPDRILLGLPEGVKAEKIADLYAPLLDGSYYARQDAVPGRLSSPPRLLVTSVKSAELIKHASNAFLALKISYINAVSTICERVGADVREVAYGMGADARIGPQFLQPGIGYGGSCFPKDVLAFRRLSQDAGYDFALLDEVVAINDDQKLRFMSKMREALWTLRGKKLAVLGLAFKGGTDDIRESPAIDIVRRLLAEGATIQAFDPAAMERTRQSPDMNAVEFAEDAYGACEGADALVILAEWPQFAELDFARIRGLLRSPVIVDGKNLLDPQSMSAAGFTCYSVGSPTATPSAEAHASATSHFAFAEAWDA